MGRFSKKGGLSISKTRYGLVKDRWLEWNKGEVYSLTLPTRHLDDEHLDQWETSVSGWYHVRTEGDGLTTVVCQRSHDLLTFALHFGPQQPAARGRIGWHWFKPRGGNLFLAFYDGTRWHTLGGEAMQEAEWQGGAVHVSLRKQAFEDVVAWADLALRGAHWIEPARDHYRVTLLLHDPADVAWARVLRLAEDQRAQIDKRTWPVRELADEIVGIETELWECWGLFLERLHDPDGPGRRLGHLPEPLREAWHGISVKVPRDLEEWEQTIGDWLADPGNVAGFWHFDDEWDYEVTVTFERQEEAAMFRMIYDRGA